MARRSNIDMVQANIAVPRGHDAFWKIIRELDKSGPWDLKAIDSLCNVDVTTIRDFVRRLVKAGIAIEAGERPQSGTGLMAAKLFRLQHAPHETPRLDRNGVDLGETQQATLWRGMKMLKVFDAGELARETSLPHRPIQTTRAALYIRALARVGVLVKIAGSQNPVRYRLAQNLGAKAPTVSKTEVVFDPNSKRIVGTPTLEVSR